MQPLPRSVSLPPSEALDSVTARALAGFAPPPMLTVSEWADRERILSPEASAEAGRWDTARAEYLRGVMDAMTTPAVRCVVVAKASQVGYTECLGNIVGYFVDQDPGSMLVVQPTVEMGEAWSKDRLVPMLRDTPRLAGKVSAPQSRDASNTLRQKQFPGGRLAIVGANSPAGLASRPVRIVLADEVDRWPVSAGSEGDPLALAAKRQATFWNRKTLVGSTPTLKGTSVIWREWLASDQRKFFVPCPDCNEPQVLVWSNVRWDKAQSGKHLAGTAHYVCEHCGSIWTDADRHDSVARGHWRATNAEGAAHGVAGFHISALISPWVALSDVVTEFLAARKDAALLQVWTNTVLGEPFEEEREVVEATSLMTRGENYGLQSVPETVRFLTAGVDTQGDRLEVQIVGWGPFEESWAVRYAVLPGDPAQQYVWDQLDAVLRETYCREDGREMRVRLTAIDSGGHHAHAVHSYCRRRKGVVAVRGVAGAKPIWSGRASKTKAGYRVFWVGVDTAKDVIYSRLRFTEPGPGYMHFPVGGMFGDEYFRQLTSEEVQTRYSEGRPYRVWMLPGGRRNEALDTAVYALAARQALPYRLDTAAPKPRPPAPPPAPLTADEFVALAEKVPPAPPPPQYRTGLRRGRMIVRSSFLAR
ncbi:phage terminase large subunit family protein [Bradyrhizobium sp. HKCCYLRH3061]